MSRWRRIAIQAPLGFGAGLPYKLTGGTLTAWLTLEGESLETIGWFGLVGLAYNFKYLWAPLLDRYAPPLLGRRRGWLLVFQLCLLAAIAWLGASDPSAHAAFAAAAVAVAFFSASQDVVVDAYRTDVLPANERGRGAATYVIAYRIALLVAGAGALRMSEYVGWRVTYFALAGLMAVGMVGTLLAPEPPRTAPPRSLVAAVVAPFLEFFRRPGVLGVLAFVMLFMLGDVVAAHFTNKFLLDLGFSRVQVGDWRMGVGMIATIAGVAIGGRFCDRLGILRALLVFGLLQAVANTGYIALAVVGADEPLLVAAIVIDNVCNGLGMAAFVAFLMSQCKREFSAFQYALLTSASSILGKTVRPAVGVVIAHIGWAWFYAATIAVALPALMLLAFGLVRVPEVADDDDADAGDEHGDDGDGGDDRPAAS